MVFLDEIASGVGLHSGYHLPKIVALWFLRPDAARMSRPAQRVGELTMNFMVARSYQMRFNDFFRTIYCINLDRRPDRWSRVMARFEHHRFRSVIRYPAIDGKLVQIPETWSDVPGAYGCVMSHLGVVSEARACRAENVLIFEDDVVFEERFHERFDENIARVPEDWDMLLLGGSHWSLPERISDGISRVTATVATHAYALRHTIYDEFIDLNRASSHPVDCNNVVLQGRFRCYCFSPSIAWQEDGYSDIAEGVLHFGIRQGARPPERLTG